MQRRNNIQKPALGAAAIILNNDRILIGQRLSEPQSMSWQLPGGWVREGQTPEQVIEHLIRQFPDIKCTELNCVAYTNNFFDHGAHSMSLYFRKLANSVFYRLFWRLSFAHPATR